MAPKPRRYKVKSGTVFVGTPVSESRTQLVINLGGRKGKITLAKDYVIAVDGEPTRRPAPRAKSGAGTSRAAAPAKPSRATSRAKPSRADSRAKPSDAKPSGAKLSRAKASRVSPSPAKPSDAKLSHAKPSRARPSHAKPSRASPSHAKPSDAKPSHAKPSRARPSRAKPSRAASHAPATGASVARSHAAKPGRAAAAGRDERPYQVFTNLEAFGNEVTIITLFFARSVAVRAQDAITALVPPALQSTTRWISDRVLVTSAAEWYGLSDEPTERWLADHRAAVDRFIAGAHASAPLAVVFASVTIDLPGLAAQAKADLTSALPDVIAALTQLWSAKPAERDTVLTENVTYSVLRAMMYEQDLLTDDDRAALVQLYARCCPGGAIEAWAWVAEKLGLPIARKAPARR